MLPYNSKASIFHFFLCSVLKGTALLFGGGIFVIAVSMLETTSWFSVGSIISLRPSGYEVEVFFLFFFSFFPQHSGYLGICLVYSDRYNGMLQWKPPNSFSIYEWTEGIPWLRRDKHSALQEPAGCWDRTIPQPTLASARNLLTFVLFHGRVIYHWHLLATSTGGHCSGARFKEVGRNWSRHFIS